MPPTDRPDHELIHAMLGGDRRAARRLARRYHAQLYAYFRNRLEREDAEDLTQLTLLHTVVRIEAFRGESSFRHYVFSIARRILFERHRKIGRRPMLEPTVDEDGTESGDLCLNEWLCRCEAHEQVVRAVNDLREHYRVVVWLHLRGADNSEIANMLAIESNTVRSRLSRGLSSVRERLATAPR